MIMWLSILGFIVIVIGLALYSKWQCQYEAKRIHLDMQAAIIKMEDELQRMINKNKEDPDDPFINSVDDLL